MATDYDKGELTDREKEAGKNQEDLAKYSDNTLTDVANYNRQSARRQANWLSSEQNRLAKQNRDQTKQITQYNAGATSEQLGNQMSNYDFANRQNAKLRDVQYARASRKAEAERFEAQRNLQNAALGLFGSMNQAMNGSTIGNAMKMLANRNDADNSTYWENLQDNRQAIRNAYDESYNQNQVAKRDAAANALKALQDIDADLASNLSNIQGDLYSNLVNTRADLLTNYANNYGDLYANRRNARADLAANLNNINPNLYTNPDETSLGKITVPDTGYEIARVVPQGGTGANGRISLMQNDDGTLKNTIYEAPGTNANLTNLQNSARNTMNGVRENNAQLLNYIMPANAEQNVRGYRNRLRGNDYFSRLINGFNS